MAQGCGLDFEFAYSNFNYGSWCHLAPVGHDVLNDK